jgi:hypothetical protein
VGNVFVVVYGDGNLGVLIVYIILNGANGYIKEFNLNYKKRIKRNVN